MSPLGSFSSQQVEHFVLLFLSSESITIDFYILELGSSECDCIEWVQEWSQLVCTSSRILDAVHSKSAYHNIQEYPVTSINHRAIDQDNKSTNKKHSGKTICSTFENQSITMLNMSTIDNCNRSMLQANDGALLVDKTDDTRGHECSCNSTNSVCFECVNSKRRVSFILACYTHELRCRQWMVHCKREWWC